MTIDSEPALSHPAGPSVQDVLSHESTRQRVPAVLRQSAPSSDLDTADLPNERYITKAYHDAEVEHVWRKVWQMACRVDDLREVGDVHVYDIVNDSILIVRTAPDDENGPGLKAYYNACLHRGTALKIEDGNVPCLRCPFHGWTWNLDGSINHIPSMWDLPHVDPAAMSLPEVAVDTWDGWLFVNMADDPPPLREFLGPLVEHFEPFPLEGRFTALHVLARLPCNWKLALEAFIESYHVWITHPEIAPYSADEGTQYDILSEHVSRMITLEGLPSAHLGDSVDERTAAETMISGFGLGDPAAVAAAPADQSGRDVVAGMMRVGFGAMYGVDLSAVSNTELLDAIEYLLFPNFTPWGGFGLPIVYRFRPDGDDHESSLMDIRLMAPLPPGAPRPPSAPVHLHEDGQDWNEIPDIGALGPVFAQDTANLRRMQRGLRTTRKPGVTLTNYQESRIRHHAATIERYISAGRAAEQPS
jgi:nitrite reductase/ring-hydroxylating ferredoxin subunit